MNQLNLIGGFTSILTTTLPFLVVAALFLRLAMRIRRKQQAARGWPSTQGRVLASEVQSRPRKQGNAGGSAMFHYAHVVYQYRVGGIDYSCNRLNPGMELGYGNPDHAAARAARYPLGAQVTVFYNPLDPNDATLEHGAPRLTLFYWIGGGMLLILLLSLASSFGVLQFTQGIVGSLPR